MKLLFFLTLIFSSSFALADSNAKKLLVLGDSLSEGYGVAKEAAYASLLETKILADKKNWKVLNASISGSTSASGVGRLKWQLKNKPDLMLLILGANDGLRGLKVEETEKHILETVDLAMKNQVKVILFGMKMPPNYGLKYTQDFEALFAKVAKKTKVPFVPFLLDGVAGDPKMNLADGIHPNEEGHKRIAENVYKAIKDEL
jgi:acyl-CoA thioesterase-1